MGEIESLRGERYSYIEVRRLLTEANNTTHMESEILSGPNGLPNQ